MATKQYKFRQQLKKSLKLTMERFPDGKHIKYRYNTLRFTLLNFYPTMVGSMTKDEFIEMLRAIIYLDRQIRLETEGIDEEEKEILSQEFQITQLGAIPGINNQIKQIKSI